MSEPLEVLRTCVAHGLPDAESGESERDPLELTAEVISLASGTGGTRAVVVRCRRRDSRR